MEKERDFNKPLMTPFEVAVATGWCDDDGSCMFVFLCVVAVHFLCVCFCVLWLCTFCVCVSVCCGCALSVCVLMCDVMVSLCVNTAIIVNNGIRKL